MDAIEICKDLVIPKPRDAIAFVLQKRASLSFWRQRAIVVAAVDFYNQPGLVGHKIGNVAADRHLAAELVSLHLTSAQGFARPDFPPRSCLAAKCELAHVRR